MTRKKTAGSSCVLRAAAGLSLSLLLCLSPWWLRSEALPGYLKAAAAFAARIELPLWHAQPIETGTPAEQPDSGQQSAAETSTSTVATSTSTTAATTTATPTAGLKPVLEKQIQKSGASGTGGNSCVFVKNSSGYEIDIDKLLSLRPDCWIKLNAGYQVLIVHTHTTEGYAETDSDFYDPERSARTTDSEQSVVAVGKIIAEKLEAAGIKTLHVTTVHDYPEYNGSYNRASQTIEAYLEKYPSIEMVIDVHRDSITYDDGTKVKPTAEIDGRKAAQVMILTGCDAGGSLYFPDWRVNMRMALSLQKQLESDHPGLTRPVYFVPYRYNMQLTTNSLLLEFGTDVNTLEEAKYSAELVGDSLAALLKGYEV